MLKKFFIGLFVAVAAVAIVGALNYCAWFLGHDSWTHRDLASWKTARGELQSLKIYPYLHKGSRYYSVSCQYSFTADGKSFTGNEYEYPDNHFGTPENARAAVERDLHLKKPVWSERDPGDGSHHTLQADGISVEVLYYPGDPSVSMLVNGFDKGMRLSPQGWSIMGFIGMGLVGFIALFFNGAVIAGVFVGIGALAQSLRPKPPPEVQVPVAADICDQYIPLLDEGIAAAKVLAVELPRLKQELDFQIKEFEKLKQQALSHRLFLVTWSMSLGRQFDYEWGDTKVQRRFVRAIDAIDGFHRRNLMFREQPQAKIIKAV